MSTDNTNEVVNDKVDVDEGQATVLSSEAAFLNTSTMSMEERDVLDEVEAECRSVVVSPSEEDRIVSIMSMEEEEEERERRQIVTVTLDEDESIPAVMSDEEKDVLEEVEEACRTVVVSPSEEDRIVSIMSMEETEPEAEALPHAGENSIASSVEKEEEGRAAIMSLEKKNVLQDVEAEFPVIDDDEEIIVPAMSMEEIELSNIKAEEGTAECTERGNPVAEKIIENVDVLSHILSHAAASFPPEKADKLYNDKLNEMTRGRRLARIFSMKFKWYNPSDKLEGDGPSLDAAWAYFEHSVLPRHFLNQSDRALDRGFLSRMNKRDLLKRAEYGNRDEKTKLYNVWTTPEAELADFGISVGIYFWTLRVFAMLSLIAGLISLPNMIYFSSTEYTSDGHEGLFFGLQASAACTDSEWVACPTCSRSDWDGFPSTYGRYATSDGLTFVLRNNCNITFNAAIVAWATLVFFCTSIGIMNFVSRRREVLFDIASQTTSDYSIEVTNPPPDAFDPDEWKAFFLKFDEEAQVAAVTVAIDNEQLLRTLLKRRLTVRQIEYLMKPGVRFDQKDLDTMVANCVEVPLWKKYVLFQRDGNELLHKIRILEKKAKELAAEETKVSRVYVIFNTEKSQRIVLNTLSMAASSRMLGGELNVPEEHKFKGVVLNIKEPVEPSSLLWQFLDETFYVKLGQLTVSFVVTVSAIVVGAVLVALAGRESPIWASVTVTSINQVTPRVCKFITNRFESHASDGARQSSLYVKMTVFKWVNTAIVTAIITPFVYTISPGNTELLRKVYSIFFAELLTNPLILLSDSWGHIQRHILGPRESDQERMNLRFSGGLFLISLRYTELTKILFLTFFYSSVYPAGFFFAAASLIINYYVDKFCLLRTYGPAPTLGNHVAEFSRSYFYTSALAVYAIMLSYNFAGFPFDNICEDDDIVPAEYVGMFTATTGENVQVTVSIAADDNTFSFCNQDMLRFDPRVFPAIPSFQLDGMTWMTDEQEKGTWLLGCTSVVIVFGVAVILIVRLILHTRFFTTYKPTGEASEERFSETEESYGYVPQVKNSKFQYPLLTCDISQVPEDLVDWSDPGVEYPFNKHNLIHDIPDLVVGDKQIFSIIKAWKTD